QQKSPSNFGILGRIQKRKVPVRRPTAYVSPKGTNRAKDEDENKDRPADTDTPEI
ncbi:hypothetical protein Angca_000268, partial [Angiostrongylus cantonensis]